MQHYLTVCRGCSLEDVGHTDASMNFITMCPTRYLNVLFVVLLLISAHSKFSFYLTYNAHRHAFRLTTSQSSFAVMNSCLLKVTFHQTDSSADMSQVRFMRCCFQPKKHAICPQQQQFVDKFA